MEESLSSVTVWSMIDCEAGDRPEGVRISVTVVTCVISGWSDLDVAAEGVMISAMVVTGVVSGWSDLDVAAGVGKAPFVSAGCCDHILVRDVFAKLLMGKTIRITSIPMLEIISLIQLNFHQYFDMTPHPYKMIFS